MKHKAPILFQPWQDDVQHVANVRARYVSMSKAQRIERTAAEMRAKNRSNISNRENAKKRWARPTEGKE